MLFRSHELGISQIDNQNLQNKIFGIECNFEELNGIDLAKSYKKDGMLAYSKFQELEFEHERTGGYMATTHQKFVGAGYFDRVVSCVSGGKSSVGALSGSTEEAQF